MAMLNNQRVYGIYLLGITIWSIYRGIYFIGDTSPIPEGLIDIPIGSRNLQIHIQDIQDIHIPSKVLRCPRQPGCPKVHILGSLRLFLGDVSWVT